MGLDCDLDWDLDLDRDRDLDLDRREESVFRRPLVVDDDEVDDGIAFPFVPNGLEP